MLIEALTLLQGSVYGGRLTYSWPPRDLVPGPHRRRHVSYPFASLLLPPPVPSGAYRGSLVCPAGASPAYGAVLEWEPPVGRSLGETRLRLFRSPRPSQSPAKCSDHIWQKRLQSQQNSSKTKNGASRIIVDTGPSVAWRRCINTLLSGDHFKTRNDSQTNIKVSGTLKSSYILLLRLIN